jgi:magnesium chelatase family protein
MSQITIQSATIIGTSYVPVEITVSTTRSQIPRMDIVGVSGAAAREIRVRVRQALRSCELSLGDQGFQVEISGAPKGAVSVGYDLAVALGLLAAAGKIPQERLDGLLVVGELSLAGAVRPVRGILPMLLRAVEDGITDAIVPEGCVAETALCGDEIEIYGVSSLAIAIDAYTTGENRVPRDLEMADLLPEARPRQPLSLDDIKGLKDAKEALRQAIATGESLLIWGPPGCGKTMLAVRAPGLMPEMTKEEETEVVSVWSAAGMPQVNHEPIRRPFRAPHHTISATAMAGGGAVCRPGEVSLAHNGVLFLDELPEFRRSVLDMLRQPLQEGQITHSRDGRQVAMKAQIQLIAAASPCPCGYHGSKQRQCRCTLEQIKRYRDRLKPYLSLFDREITI